MKYAYLFLILFIAACSSNSNKVKEINHPIEEITWIKEFISETKKSPFPTKVVISQYKFKEETVFLINHCFKCADEMKVLYNTKKEKLSTFGGMIPNQNKYPNFFEEATEKKELWRSF